MKKKILLILPLVIAAVTFIFVYRYYNKEDKTTTLTVKEKQWVQRNSNKEYDFEIINDYPLYGLNGEGIIFSFIWRFLWNLKNVIVAVVSIFQMIMYVAIAYLKKELILINLRSYKLL